MAVSVRSYYLLLLSLLVASSVSFVVTTTPTRPSSFLAVASQESKMKQQEAYTDQELLGALNGLLDDSADKDFDARHIYGYGDESHTLSMLQTITATRELDYREYMVS